MRAKLPIMAIPDGDAAARLDAATARLLTYFRPRSGRWKSPTGEAWQPALAVDVVIDGYRRTGRAGHRAVLERSFNRYRGRRSHFHDDDGWYLNTWLRAFEATGDPGYLAEARALFAGLTTGWDDTFGGGVWWNRDRTYKNAITNGLFLLGAAGLARLVPAEPVYRAWADAAWRWFDRSGMVNADGLVNDGLDGSGSNNHGTTWTYNQGTVVHALVELAHATGDRTLLRPAAWIADAALAGLVDRDGVLREPCEPAGCDGDQQIFKGVFARSLAALHRADPERGNGYPTFLSRNADSVWRTARDHRDGIGLSWRGPIGGDNLATQASACLLLGAAADVAGA